MKIVKDIKLTKNFNLSEFQCKDNDKSVYIDMNLVNKLQILRDKIGLPLRVISGYRTESYNKKVGGSPKSQHILGKAADISLNNINIELEKIIDMAISIGFTGIGIYGTFIHLDVRDNPHPRGYSFW